MHGDAAPETVDGKRDRAEIQRQLLTESLALLQGSMSGGAALGHLIAGIAVTLALRELADKYILVSWLALLAGVSLACLLLGLHFRRRQASPEDNRAIYRTRAMIGIIFLRASVWGSSALILWPVDMAYRVFLVTVLAGVVAALATRLALHRRELLLCCLPIAAPLVFQLVRGGSELELILAALFAFHIGLLLLSVGRLTDAFLESLKLRLSTRNESRTDALTGLANRRRFDEALGDLWQQAIRSAQPIGLMWMDLDSFKDYNDRYGHPQGDAALRRFGDLLRRVLSRSTDVCARVGGDEFAVIMPATDLKGSKLVAAAVCKQVDRMALPHPGSERGHLTISIGVNACRPDRDTSLEDFVRQGDRALYRDKMAGKDRVNKGQGTDQV